MACICMCMRLHVLASFAQNVALSKQTLGPALEFDFVHVGHWSFEAVPRSHNDGTFQNYAKDELGRCQARQRQQRKAKACVSIQNAGDLAREKVYTRYTKISKSHKQLYNVFTSMPCVKLFSRPKEKPPGLSNWTSGQTPTRSTSAKAAPLSSFANRDRWQEAPSAVGTVSLLYT